MADGTIRIATKLDTSGTKKDLAALEKMIDRAAANIQKATAQLMGDPASGIGKAEDAVKQLTPVLESVNEKIKRVAESMDALGQTKIAAPEFVALNKEIDATWDKIHSLDDRMRRFTETGGNENSTTFKRMEYDADGLYNTLESLLAKKEQLEQSGGDYIIGADTGAYADLMAQMSDIAVKTQSLNDSYAGLTGVISEVRGEIESADDAQKKLEEDTKEYGSTANGSFKEAASAADTIKDSLERAAKKVARFSIAMLGVRGIYSLLRKAANAYMSDNETLTNRIAMAWSSLGQMLGPIIEYIVNLFLKAIGYINAFVSALTGINYIAKANAKSLNKQAGATAAAGGAAAKAEKQLASFDEQNKLTDTSSGGGGGGGGGSVGGLEFETPELDPDFLAKIEWLAAHFKDILWYVGAIAAGVLGWKIASAFTDSLGKCAAVAAALAGTVVYVKGFIDAFKNGVDWKNLSEMLGGMVVAAIALGIAFGPVAAAVALLVGGIGLLVVGIKDFIETGEMSVPVFAAIETGILAIGTAIGLLTAAAGSIINPIPLIIAAIVGLVVAIVTYWDEIKAAVSTAIQWIKDLFSKVINWINTNVIKPISNFYTNKIKPLLTELVNWVSTKFHELMDWLDQHVIQPIVSVYEKWIKPTFDKIIEIIKKVCEIISALFGYLWGRIKEIFAPVVQWFREKFNAAKDAVVNAFSSVASFFSGIWQSIKNVFANVTTWFRNKFSEAWQAIKNVFAPFGDFFAGLWDKIKTTFSTLGTSIGNAISGAVKSGINGVISLIQNTINGAISLINGAINLINKLPGVHVSKVSYLYLPRLARGGIVNNPGRGVPLVAGEAGREAILPLDNNTGWMDILAEKINGGTNASQIVIPVYLSGKQIARYVVDLQARQAFATNGA